MNRLIVGKNLSKNPIYSATYKLAEMIGNEI